MAGARDKSCRAECGPSCVPFRTKGQDMKQLMRLAAAAAVGAVAAGSIVYAQTTPAEPPEAIVSLYRAAPGQQENLLRWLDQQNRVAVAARVAPTQLYIHTNGDSWDYMAINPVTTSAQDRGGEDAAKQVGGGGGPRAGLELRNYVAPPPDPFGVVPVRLEQALGRLSRRKRPLRQSPSHATRRCSRAV